jgi:hypothetical protein
LYTHTNSERETSSCLLDLFPFPSPVTPPLPPITRLFSGVCVCVCYSFRETAFPFSNRSIWAAATS